MHIRRVVKADFRIVNCTFSNNSNSTVFSVSFSGLLVFENCTIAQLRDTGALHISKIVDSPPCQMVIRNSRIADTFTTALELDRYALIQSFNCVTFVSNITITNVTILADISVKPNGLLTFTATESWLSNITVVNSGYFGCVVQTSMCTLHLSDFTLENFNSKLGYYFYDGLSTTFYQNVRVSKGFSVAYLGQYSFGYKTMYFGVAASYAEIRNISVSDSTVPMGPCFTVAFSNYSISDVSLSRLSMGSVLLSPSSNGHISNIRIDQIKGDMHVFIAGHSVVSISNITFSNSEMDYFSVAIGMSTSLVTIFNFTITNSSAASFLGILRSNAEIVDLTIENSFGGRSNCYIIGSQAHVTGLKLYKSLGQRMIVSGSNFTVENSLFDSPYFNDFFLVVTSSNVSFINLSGISMLTEIEFGRVSQGSKVTMEHCKFEKTHAKVGMGWQISDSEMHISNSIFRDYNFGLFQAVNTNVTLSGSTFVEGRNVIQSLKSKAAFGGVLSCIDCPIVIIQSTKFFNISARVAGAVAVKRNINEEELMLIVEKSEFIGCRAQQAGAIFIQNVSFIIDSSVFSQNSAEQAGGGIYAAIKPWQSGLIRHSRFAKNSASEGGAIKWTNAQIFFTNTTFQENSAGYGLDIASYGVQLSSTLTRLIGNESSGYPFTIVFELLDHYGKRVNLSPFKHLLLLSTPTITYRGNNVTLLRLGIFTFSDQIVYAPPATTQAIQAVFNDTQEDMALNLVGEVVVRFRSCKSGEIERADRCEYCYPGYFSFSPSDSDCSHCPSRAFCPGGNVLEVVPGYWRRSWNSSELLSCPFPAKCLGGVNSTCLSSFTGVLCHQCDSKSARIISMECVKCRKLLVILQFSAPVLVVILFRAVVYRLVVHKSSADRLFVLKVTISHLRYLSALCFLRVSYSEAIKWILHAVNWFSVLLISDLPLACLGISSPEYAKALIGSLLLPALLLLDRGIYHLRASESRTYSQIRVSSLLYYTPFITLFTSFPFLACREVDSSEEQLSLDMSVTCWQGSHKKDVLTLVLPSVLLNVVAPFALVAAIRVFRPGLFNRSFLLWTAGYKLRLFDCFQSGAQCFFLCTLIITTVVSPLGQAAYSFTTLIFVCTINVTLHKYIYASYKHFLIAEASLVTVSLSAGFLSYYIFYLPGDRGTEYFANTMVILLNAAFLGLCAWSFGSSWLNVKQEDEGDGAPVPPNTPELLIIASEECAVREHIRT